jgi:hypothetical protein
MKGTVLSFLILFTFSYAQAQDLNLELNGPNDYRLKFYDNGEGGTNGRLLFLSALHSGNVNFNELVANDSELIQKLNKIKKQVKELNRRSGNSNVVELEVDLVAKIAKNNTYKLEGTFLIRDKASSKEVSRMSWPISSSPITRNSRKIENPANYRHEILESEYYTLVQQMLNGMFDHALVDLSSTINAYPSAEPGIGITDSNRSTTQEDNGSIDYFIPSANVR